MRQQPLVISASARRQSDTLKYVQFVLERTDHKLISLLDFHIAPYNYEARYPANDMFAELAAEMLKHEIIIFATPVYWYAMSGLLKIFLDRFTDLVTTQKHLGRNMEGKLVFLIAVGSDETLPDGFEIPFKRTAGYFDMNYKACIYFSTNHPKSEQEKRENKKAFIEELEQC
jgi:multimeric flavodoxin WrbA